jgi:hypothetical protein
MKYNKLIPRKRRLQYETPADESRCSGRSTARVLRYLAQIIENPCEWFTIRDHRTPEGDPTTYTNSHIADHVQKLAEEMKLQFIERRNHDGKGGYGVTQLRSNHFTDNIWEIE